MLLIIFMIQESYLEKTWITCMEYKFLQVEIFNLNWQMQQITTTILLASSVVVVVISSIVVVVIC